MLLMKKNKIGKYVCKNPSQVQEQGKIFFMRDGKDTNSFEIMIALSVKLPKSEVYFPVCQTVHQMLPILPQKFIHIPPLSPVFFLILLYLFTKQSNLHITSNLPTYSLFFQNRTKFEKTVYTWQYSKILQNKHHIKEKILRGQHCGRVGLHSCFPT